MPRIVVFISRGWNVVTANTILVTIEKAGEDSELHDITAKRSNLLGVMVCSSHLKS